MGAKARWRGMVRAAAVLCLAAGAFQGTLSVRVPGGSRKDVAWKILIRE